ncbi:MAG: prolyl-tRNA synthetase associated domain-containing protein [Alphaproteobacteria bacterium]
MNSPQPSTALNPESPLPTTPENLLRILEELGITYEIHHHTPIFTVEEGQHLKERIPGLHCRNLFLRDKKDAMFLVVLANQTRVDLKKLDSVIGAHRLSFGSADRLGRYLGIYPGAVCPFTVVNDKNHDVQVILDAFMMKAPVVNYHPLDNAQTISLSPAGLLRFFAHTGHTPKIVDLGAAAP